MKICFVFGNLAISDGVSKAAIGIANFLASIGHDVTVAPLYIVENDACQMLDKRVRVKPVFGIYFKGFAKMLRCFCPQWILEKRIFEDKYDIEVAFQYDVPTLVVGRSSNRKAKHYCWMHCYDTGLMFRKSYMNMDRLFCVSKENAERLRTELGPGAPPVDFCYNLIDDSFVRECGEAPVGLEKKGFTFVSVSRLSPEKGLMRLLSCMRKLIDNGYEASLWIVGDGPQREELVTESHRLHLEDAVTFTGNKTNPHPYTKNADCFVCSSLSEGYSTACTEAIMLGTPVISTSVPGAGEIVGEAEAGLVVGNDEESLYEGMKMVLDDSNLVRQWRETILRTRVRFGLASRQNKLIQIFED